MNQKQPNQVRGNRVQCINFSMCPLCYGCRSFNPRDPECVICKEDGVDGSKRNFNVCDTNLHEAWKINNIVTKNSIEINDTVTFMNGGK